MSKLQTCNNCIYAHTKLCTTYPKLCVHFTIHDSLLEQRRAELINYNTEKDLYRQFFYTMRMYLDAYSPYNRYEDFWLYFSLDQNKFLKRSVRNKKNIGHWILIEYDKYKFYHIKQILGFNNPKDTITLNGRIVNGGIIKDDYFKVFESLVKDAFIRFFNNNKVNIVKKELKDSSINTKKLF